MVELANQFKLNRKQVNSIKLHIQHKKAMELSVYFIKPEAFASKNEIEKIIASKGLTIILSKVRTLPLSILDKIYPEFSTFKSNNAIQILSESEFVVGIVSGKSAVKKMIEICGTNSAPSNCNEGTIRKIFGIHEPQFIDGIEYVMNAIYRSENKEDAIRDFELLRKYTSIFKDYSFL